MTTPIIPLSTMEWNTPIHSLPTAYPTSKTVLIWSPRVESNHDQRLRSPLFYPLNYKGVWPQNTIIMTGPLPLHTL